MQSNVGNGAPSEKDETTASSGTRQLSLRGRLTLWGSAPESIALLTLLLVFLTAWLIVATYALENRTVTLNASVTKESDIIGREEQIIDREATDSPPQAELGARIRPPLPYQSAGVLVFQNEGSSFVQTAYVWCWGDNADKFNANDESNVHDARRLHSIGLRGSATIDFGSCSGQVGKASESVKPRYFYTFTVYRTPSGNCKNRQQYFVRSVNLQEYVPQDDPGAFPKNLKSVALTSIRKDMQDNHDDWKSPVDCLAPEQEL